MYQRRAHVEERQQGTEATIRGIHATLGHDALIESPKLSRFCRKNATKMGKDGSLPAHVQRFDRIITKDLVFQMMPISDVESGRIKKLVAPFSGT